MSDETDDADDPRDPRGRFGDPRLDDRYLRYVPPARGSGAVVLVGVVHDHPASTFRVRRLVEALAPDVLALELPPLAVPLFRLYARDDRTPPRLGGEMSAAIQAFGGGRTAGIDAPNRRYLRLLLARLSGGTSRGTAASVLKDAASGLAHALACRLAAFLGTVSPLRLRVYAPIEYTCSASDSPAVQADHEATHVSQRQALLRAIEVPPPIRLIDETREESMARAILEFRVDGDVLAVVGMEHLAPVYDRLRDAS